MVGCDSAVGIETRCKLDVLEIESQLGAGVSLPSIPALRPLSRLYNVHWLCFLGLKRPGCDVDYLPTSRAIIKDRVQLYLCSLAEPSRLVLG